MRTTILLLLTITTSAFIFTGCSKMDNPARSVEEVRSLIQDDNTTQVYNEFKKNTLRSIALQNNSDKNGISEEELASAKEVTITYFKDMLNRYPELSVLSDEEKIEVIFNLSLTQLNDYATANQNVDVSKAVDCDELYDAANAFWDAGTVLHDAGLSGLGYAFDAAFDALIDVWFDKCY